MWVVYVIGENQFFDGEIKMFGGLPKYVRFDYIVFFSYNFVHWSVQEIGDTLTRRR